MGTISFSAAADCLYLGHYFSMVRISKVVFLRHGMRELCGKRSARQPSPIRRPPSRDLEVSSVECLSVEEPTRRVRGRLRAALCPSACRVLIFRAGLPLLAYILYGVLLYGAKYRLCHTPILYPSHFNTNSPSTEHFRKKCY